MAFPNVWQLFRLQLPSKHVRVCCTARTWLWAQPGSQPGAGTLWTNHSNCRGQEILWILFFINFRYIGNRVTVHSRNTTPLIEDNGVMVEPNTATDIAIERVSTSFSLQIYLLKRLKSKGNLLHMANASQPGMNEDAFEFYPGIMLPYQQGVV